ncbi:preprotein translocase subunit YajC, partial [Bifidobacterium bifidum]
MPQGSSSYLIMIVSIVLIGIMMWWQSRKAKQQQQKMKDFRSSLEPGTEVITIGGIIGKVVSVDEEYEEIVIDSEGSLLRFTFRAINKEYTR